MKKFRRLFLNSPIQVTLGITNSCNLKCIHCRANASSKSSKELKIEEIKNILKCLSDMKVLYLEISGGEPLIRKDFFEIVKFANENNLEVITSTNGMLIDKEVARKIKESGIKKIQVSLDGAINKTHDYFRGVKGSFEKAINAIKNLVSENVYVVVSTILNKNNVNEIEKIINIVTDLGAKQWRGLVLLPCGRGRDIFNRLKLSFKELNKINLLCKKKKMEFGEKILLEVEKCFNLGERIPLNNLKYDLGEASCFGCGAGISEIYIDHKGNIYPCSKMVDVKFLIGNIRKDSLKKLWKSSLILEKFRDVEKNIKGKCIQCKLNIYCKGGCKAVSWSLLGDEFSPDPRCPFNKKQNPELLG